MFVPLRPTGAGAGKTWSHDWRLDTAELTSAFSSKTKAIIVNTPNNTLDKIYSRLKQKLARLAKIFAG